MNPKWKTPRPQRKKAAPARKRQARKRVSRQPSQKSQRIISTSAGSSSSKFMSKRRYARHGKNITALGAVNKYVITRGLNISGFDGRQTLAVIGQWGSLADIANVASTVPSPAPPSGTGINPTRFHLKSIVASVTMTNPTSTTIEVDLYDVVCRKDAPVFKTGYFGNGVALPTTAWSSGMLQQAIQPSLPYPAEQYLGALPTDSQLFKDYYRVLKRTSVSMAQASTHVHHVNISFERDFDRGELQVQTDYLAQVANFSHFTMAVVRGQPARDVTQSTSYAMSTTVPILFVLSLENYQYSWLQSAGSFWSGTTTLPPQGAVLDVLNLNTPTVGIPISA